MADKQESGHSSREISRWIAYPVLAVASIGTIIAGLGMGQSGIGEQFMIASMQSSPAENWTISLLAVCIATLMYASWAYSNRTLRCSLQTLAFVTGYVVVLFLFGAWGLYGIVLAWAIWFVVFWIRNRHPFARNRNNDREC